MGNYSVKTGPGDSGIACVHRWSKICVGCGQTDDECTAGDGPRSAAAASLSLAKEKTCDDGQIGRVRRLLLVGKLGAVNFIVTWSRICRGELVALDGVNVRTRITVPFFLGKSKDFENTF